MKIPDKGIDKDVLFKNLEEYKENDIKWRSGKTWGFIYDPGEQAQQVSKQAYMMYLTENALDPTAFPSLLRLENEIVAMIAPHVGGDENAVGNFTTGGTESIILAVKSARDFNRERRPEIKKPEMILPTTAHAAFQKAAHYLDIKVVLVDVDDKTFKARIDKVKQAVNENTILIIGSAPSYAHGVIDPIEKMGQVALENNILFHVDACMGGFMLPFYKRLGQEIPNYDLTVPGVTSLSVDLHKYAYCPKGASLVIYPKPELRKYQMYACAAWTGYSIINPTVGSSKSGGPLAAAWATLQFIGDDGYLEIARKKIECMEKLKAGIEKMDDLELQGNPEMTLVCFTSDKVNVFHVIDMMNSRGWYVQPQLAFANSKENIHISIAVANVDWVDDLLKDLADCVQLAKGKEKSELSKMVTEAFSAIDPSQLTDEVFEQMMDMAGINGTDVPDEMAEINEILNALPYKLREKLLLEFLNKMFHYKSPEGK